MVCQLKNVHFLMKILIFNPNIDEKLSSIYPPASGTRRILSRYAESAEKADKNAAPAKAEAAPGHARRVRVHSVRRASTGSFFAARPEGIRPAIKVSDMLMATSTAPATRGSTALMDWIPVRSWTI